MNTRRAKTGPIPRVVPRLLGDVLERATGMTLAAYLEKSIWQPYGMASDGVWHAYSKGQHDVGAHGFNATLEDWGRFGEFILHNGTLPDGKQILPEGWVKQSSASDTGQRIGVRGASEGVVRLPVVEQ